MSTTYCFHVEIKLKDKWFCIDPIIKDVNGQIRTVPFKEGGSYLFETINTLEESRVSWGVPEDASEELMANFSPLDEKSASFFPNQTNREYYQQTVFVINFSSGIKDKIVKDRPYKYMGYVFRDSIPSFEVGEIDDLYWITKEEYNKLSHSEQKEYAWYEWNYTDDEYGNIYDIYMTVNRLIDWFMYNGIPYNSGYSYSDVDDSNVRIIVERC